MARLMRPARSSSHLHLEPSARIELAIGPVPGDCSAAEPRWRGGPGRTRTVTLPGAGRVRFQLRYEPSCCFRVIGGTRTRTSSSTDSRAALTRRSPCFRSAWRESNRRLPLIGRLHWPLCYRRMVGVVGLEPTASRSRTARASRCATPLRYGGEQRSRTSRPELGHPLSRRAPGTDAGRTLRDGGWRKERESNPQGSSLVRFRDGCHRHVGLSFQRSAPLPSRGKRLGGSGGNCTPVHRFKRPLQPNFCYRPRTARRARQPHPLESNQDLPLFGRTRRPATPEWEKEGVMAMHPSSSTIELSQSETVSSGPRIRTWNSRSRAARPAVGPVRIAGRSVLSGRRLPPGGAPGS